jgi:hypothetical protein
MTTEIGAEGGGAGSMGKRGASTSVGRRGGGLVGVGAPITAAAGSGSAAGDTGGVGKTELGGGSMTGRGICGTLTTGLITGAVSDGAGGGMIEAAGATGGAGAAAKTDIGRGVTPTDAALPCARCTRLRR